MSPARTWSRRSCSLLPRVQGAYSLVVMDEERVIGVRDPYGFRPLVLGRLPLSRGGRRAAALARSCRGGVRAAALGRAARSRCPVGPRLRGWVLASETAALDVARRGLRA